MKEYVEYAIYKGEEVLFIGTVSEIMRRFNVKSSTVRFWASSANKRRISKMRGGKSKAKVAVRIEDD